MSSSKPQVSRPRNADAPWVVFVSPVEFPQMTPRLRREFEAILQSGQYRALVISTETWREDLPRWLLKSRSQAGSTRILKAYSVGFVPVAYYKRRLAKPFIVALYAASQMLYILQIVVLLAHAVWSYHPKLIHVHNAPDVAALATMLVSRLTGVPYVFEMHDFAPDIVSAHMGVSRHSVVYRFLKIIEKEVVRNAAAVIAVSKSMSDNIDCPAEKKTVIYSGWSADVGASETSVATRRRYGLDGRFVVLYHGYFEEGSRSLKTPIEAIRKLRNVRDDIFLVYLGFGSYFHELERYAAEQRLGENVMFLPAVGLEEMFNLINSADVGLVPTRNTEAGRWVVGNKLLEYMAMAKPVVASRTPGNQEVIRHLDNGLLYDPDSVEEFMKAILRLYGDSQLRETLARRAREDFVRIYSAEANMEKLFGLYEEIVSGRSS